MSKNPVSPSEPTATSEGYPRIQGRCPMGCGETLFLGKGGYVTCAYLPCPNPSRVSQLLDQLGDRGRMAYELSAVDLDRFSAPCSSARALKTHAKVLVQIIKRIDAELQTKPSESQIQAWERVHQAAERVAQWTLIGTLPLSGEPQRDIDQLRVVLAALKEGK